jgi:Tfp pilus assembly protein PilZ
MAAEEYVRQYAENLSTGGLFVAGATNLRVGDVVVVEVDLPGFGQFKVEAEAVHTTDAQRAAETDRPAGTGFKIVNGPRGFQKALSAYLERLGKRQDVAVFVASDGIGRVLTTAGYDVRSAPSTQEILAALQESDKPTAGIVVPSSRVELYKNALAPAMMDDLVLGMGGVEEINKVLAILDRRILSLPS